MRRAPRSHDVERTTVGDQRSSGTETTDSEMFIADIADKDCDSRASTIATLCMQRGGEDAEKGLGGVAPLRNPDNSVASTSEWRGRVPTLTRGYPSYG